MRVPSRLRQGATVLALVLISPAAPTTATAAPAVGEASVGELLLAAREALARRDSAGALAVLERAEAALPANAEVEALLGLAHLLATHPQAALDHFARAQAAGASAAMVRLHTGTALWQLNRIEEAERAFRDALAAGGGSSAAQQLGRLLLWQGRYVEALAALEEAAQGLPADVDLGLDLARALENVGRRDEALARYRELAAREPALLEVHYRLARAMLARGDHGGAAAELAIYRQLDERRAQSQQQELLVRARIDHGWDLYRRGRASEALPVFEALPESAESLCGIGFARSALGDHAAAAAALERAVTLAPDRQDLRLQLAEERLAVGKTP
jgi:tetratricopeptide (TPR) repeat protein